MTRTALTSVWEFYQKNRPFFDSLPLINVRFSVTEEDDQLVMYMTGTIDKPCGQYDYSRPEITIAAVTEATFRLTINGYSGINTDLNDDKLLELLADRFPD